MRYNWSACVHFTPLRERVWFPTFVKHARCSISSRNLCWIHPAIPCISYTHSHKCHPKLTSNHYSYSPSFPASFWPSVEFWRPWLLKRHEMLRDGCFTTPELPNLYCPYISLSMFYTRYQLRAIIEDITSHGWEWLTASYTGKNTWCMPLSFESIFLSRVAIFGWVSPIILDIYSLSHSNSPKYLFEILFEALFILEKYYDDTVLRGDVWMVLWMLLYGDFGT